MNTLTIFVALIVAMLCDVLPPTMSKEAGRSSTTGRPPKETCKPDMKAKTRKCKEDCIDRKSEPVCGSNPDDRTCELLWFCNECDLRHYNCNNKATTKERIKTHRDNCGRKPDNIPCMNIPLLPATTTTTQGSMPKKHKTKG